MHKNTLILVLFLLKISEQEIHKNNLTNDNFYLIYLK